MISTSRPTSSLCFLFRNSKYLLCQRCVFFSRYCEAFGQIKRYSFRGPSKPIKTYIRHRVPPPPTKAALYPAFFFSGKRKYHQVNIVYCPNCVTNKTKRNHDIGSYARIQFLGIKHKAYM